MFIYLSINGILSTCLIQVPVAGIFNCHIIDASLVVVLLFQVVKKKPQLKEKKFLSSPTTTTNAAGCYYYYDYCYKFCPLL